MKLIWFYISKIVKIEASRDALKRKKMKQLMIYSQSLPASILKQIIGGGYVWVYIDGHWVKVESKYNDLHDE